MLERPLTEDHLFTRPEIHIAEVTVHQPELIAKVIEIDLMTFSEPTWSRYTAGLMLRHGRTFLLLEGELIVGNCQVIRSWDRPREAVLFSMAIRPGYRNRGLGTRFLSGVLDKLRAGGFRSVVLEVAPNNKAAMRVYTCKFGFQQVAELRDEYGVGQHRIQMRLLLQGEDLVEVTTFPGAEVSAVELNTAE